MNLKDWSVRDAIEARVRLEDMIEWARTPDVEIPKEVMQKQIIGKPAKEWSDVARFVFTGRVITKYLP